MCLNSKENLPHLRQCSRRKKNKNSFTFTDSVLGFFSSEIRRDHSFKICFTDRSSKSIKHSYPIKLNSVCTWLEIWADKSSFHKMSIAPELTHQLSTEQNSFLTWKLCKEWERRRIENEGMTYLLWRLVLILSNRKLWYLPLNLFKYLFNCPFSGTKHHIFLCYLIGENIAHIFCNLGTAMAISALKTYI